MKRLAYFILTPLIALLLAAPALAADCAEAVLSDGNGCRECALGDFAADALRAYTGADIALFPLGDLGISLLPGPVTDDAIADSFPNDDGVVVLDLSVDALREVLEDSVGHIVLNPEETIDETASAWGGFLCVSGFTFTYDASAPVGERVYSLDIEGPVTAAVPAGLLPGEPRGTVRQAVAAYCEASGAVRPPATGRILVLGAGENAIVGGLIPRGFIIVVAVVALLFGGARYRRRLRSER